LTEGDYVNISGYDLAPISGKTTETVKRILMDLKNEGLIEVKRSQITILDHLKMVKMKLIQFCKKKSIGIVLAIHSAMLV